MDSLETYTIVGGGWGARIDGVEDVEGRGDTEMDAVKSLARALRNVIEEARAALKVSP